jgi:hypothetical protein
VETISLSVSSDKRMLLAVPAIAESAEGEDG